ncbi:hypothetical protein L596_021893 [Steinernema carpocapsae]|uniref:Uncharacterized protein n=1 Tax=Steinernema carpocapsae TaxID=34508 RepID=A0A4U5MK54_STECR|nr:hypothetical protein L596_021893 [Steinernema carpocapsae]
MNHVFDTRTTVIICILMYIIPVLANVLLHVFAEDDDEGFYLFHSDTLEMGGKSSGFGDASYISTVFDWSFYLTVVIVVVTYVLAIVWHSYKKRAFSLSTTTGFFTPATANICMEMRLTIVCLVNLVPPTITTILEYAWTDRDIVGSFVFALLTISDNAINAVVLPLFSQLLRECVKKRILRTVICRRTQVVKVGHQLFDVRRSTMTTIVSPARLS